MKKVLLQIDCDDHPSAFDSIVAVDAGVDQLLRFANVNDSNVVPLVHGAMFTRGPGDLHKTGIFVGGSNVADAEHVFATIKRTMFGPLRTSVLFDPSGANTTASAAVLRCQQHIDLAGARAVIFGGTGSVGGRVASILVSRGAEILLTSRSAARAQMMVDQIGSDQVRAVQVASPDQALSCLENAQLVFATGAAGVEFLPPGTLSRSGVAVAVDVNAVPPLGIADIESGDKGKTRGQTICYGAMGVGGLKMKLHRRALQKLFERNDQILDTEAIYSLGLDLIQEG